MDETYIEIWTKTHRSRKVRRSTEVVYKETLQKHLRASFSMTGTSILMQDGAPCHRAHSNSAWFAEKPDIKVLPWPGQSPDQNPIEQLFAILKWEVTKFPPAANREELKLRNVHFKFRPSNFQLNFLGPEMSNLNTLDVFWNPHFKTFRMAPFLSL